MTTLTAITFQKQTKEFLEQYRKSLEIFECWGEEVYIIDSHVHTRHDGYTMNIYLLSNEASLIVPTWEELQ